MAKISIVDDNVDETGPIGITLRKAGHDVTSVTNGRDALASVLAATPDVVVLDLVLPELDGPSFLEIVRSYLHLHSLPVIVMTGLLDSPLIERAQHLKVNAVLLKGKLSLAETKMAIEQAVGRAPG